MSGCTWMTVVGGVLEIGGFVALIARLFDVQQREFGWPEAVLTALRDAQAITKALVDAARRAPIVKEIGQVVEVSGAGKMTVKASGTVTTGTQSLEDRVKALESALNAAREAIDKAATRADERANKIERQLDETRTSLKSTIDEIEEARREELRTSITVEAWASLAFIVGVVFSVLGNVVNC